MKFSKVQKVKITSSTERVPLSCMEGFGIFTVFIEDADHPDTGASASFTVAGNVGGASSVKNCDVRGLDGEALTLTWAAGERPKLGLSGRVNPEFLPKKYLVFAGALSVKDKDIEDQSK